MCAHVFSWYVEVGISLEDALETLCMVRQDTDPVVIGEGWRHMYFSLSLLSIY